MGNRIVGLKNRNRQEDRQANSWSAKPDAANTEERPGWRTDRDRRLLDGNIVDDRVVAGDIMVNRSSAEAIGNLGIVAHGNALSILRLSARSHIDHVH